MCLCLSEEMNGKQRGRGEKQTERLNLKKEPEVQGGGGGGRLPSEKGSVILLEPGEGTAHTHSNM